MAYRRTSMLVPTVLMFAGLLLAGAGCSGDGQVSVSGTVTAAGQPIDEGTIRFEPADGKGPSTGAAITAGNYSTRVTPGAKKVQIKGYQQVGEKKQNPADPSSPMVPVYEPNVDANVTADISEGRSDLDFNLP